MNIQGPGEINRDTTSKLLIEMIESLFAISSPLDKEVSRAAIDRLFVPPQENEKKESFSRTVRLLSEALHHENPQQLKAVVQLLSIFLKNDQLSENRDFSQLKSAVTELIQKVTGKEMAFSDQKNPPLQFKAQLQEKEGKKEIPLPIPPEKETKQKLTDRYQIKSSIPTKEKEPIRHRESPPAPVQKNEPKQRAEEKPESKQATKSELKPEAKPDTKQEVKSDSKGERRPTAKVESESDLIGRSPSHFESKETIKESSRDLFKKPSKLESTKISKSESRLEPKEGLKSASKSEKKLDLDLSPLFRPKTNLKLSKPKENEELLTPKKEGPRLSASKTPPSFSSPIKAPISFPKQPERAIPHPSSQNEKTAEPKQPTNGDEVKEKRKETLRGDRPSPLFKPQLSKTEAVAMPPLPHRSTSEAPKTITAPFKGAVPPQPPPSPNGVQKGEPIVTVGPYVISPLSSLSPRRRKKKKETDREKEKEKE